MHDLIEWIRLGVEAIICVMDSFGVTSPVKAAIEANSSTRCSSESLFFLFSIILYANAGLAGLVST